MDMRQEHACEYERVTLCAADALLEATRQTSFLACMDEAPLPLAYNKSFAHACTLVASGDDEGAWMAALDCFNGKRGDESSWPAHKLRRPQLDLASRASSLTAHWLVVRARRATTMLLPCICGSRYVGMAAWSKETTTRPDVTATHPTASVL